MDGRSEIFQCFLVVEVLLRRIRRHDRLQIARRAAVDAAHHAEVAQETEMRATALAKTAAERAEADLKDKEAAAAAAATARSQLQRYDIAAAQADADAAHRARRLAIAQTSEASPADNGQAEATTMPTAHGNAAAPAPATLEAAAPSAPTLGGDAQVLPIEAQALQQAALLPLATPVAPTTIAVGPQPPGSIFDRLGRSIACYAHAGGGRQ